MLVALDRPVRAARPPSPPGDVPSAWPIAGSSRPPRAPAGSRAGQRSSLASRAWPTSAARVDELADRRDEGPFPRRLADSPFRTFAEFSHAPSQRSAQSAGRGGRRGPSRGLGPREPDWAVVSRLREGRRTRSASSKPSTPYLDQIKNDRPDWFSGPDPDLVCGTCRAFEVWR